MINTKLKKQIWSIIGVIAIFALFNFSIYYLFTSRYIDNSGKDKHEKSIELDKYLPFDENSLIVNYNSDFKLTDNLPVLDGATALFPLYSAFVNAVYPTESSVYDYNISDFTPESYLQKTGTTGAYKSVVDGTVDIIFTAKPSEKQLQYAEDMGVNLEFVPIGYEAFVFIVNSKNKVDSITVEQVKGIYSGIYTNWKQIGGDNYPINALQRAENSGSQTAMVSFMGDTEMMLPKSNFFGKSIGYSFRLYVQSIISDSNIKVLALEGIEPSIENIRNGTYPITDCFYAVYRSDNKNENVLTLIDWILADEGQRIVFETGYVNAVPSAVDY